MKKIIFPLALLLSSIHSWGQSITVEKIYSGRYYEKIFQSTHSMKNGKDFTFLTPKGIVKKTYDNISNANPDENLLLEGAFDDYRFSDDEKYILVFQNTMPIYRHSYIATCKVYDIANKKFLSIFNDLPIQEPLLSPDNSKIAFVYQNNIYYQDLKNSDIIQITTDGNYNSIINGINDWVYEEEFGFVRQFDWSADNKQIAYVKLDESKVKEVNLPIYQQELYPSDLRFKYPKAGEDNAVASLHIFDITSKENTEIPLQNIQNYYIPKIKFTNKASVLSVVTSNRHQNKIDVSLVDTYNKKLKRIFSETSDSWIETDHLVLDFLKDNSLIWASERDGNNHLYHYDESGKLLKQITKGDWEVTDYYGIDKNNTLYFQANANQNKRISTEKHIFSIQLNGKNKKALTTISGTHQADFSGDFSLFIDRFSSISQPKTTSLIESKSGKNLGTIIDNSQILDIYNQDKAGVKELFELETENGKKLNAYIIKPKDFDPNKKYPVLMYQYSGPGSQTVSNSFHNSNDLWHFSLAQKGYLIIAVDGSGTGMKGAKFKKQTYKQLGKHEVEDQIAAAKAIQKLPYVDAERLGIWGWSFGGYMSTNCLFQGNDIFKMAIAVAPVTNWRYYDTIYTERFMQTPQENPTGYDNNSPTNHVDKFKQGKLLLIHGTADDNVHIQNTYELAEALTQANKPFDMHIYTDKNHGIYGGKTRIHLFNMMTEYVLKNL